MTSPKSKAVEILSFLTTFFAQCQILALGGVFFVADSYRKGACWKPCLEGRIKRVGVKHKTFTMKKDFFKQFEVAALDRNMTMQIVGGTQKCCWTGETGCIDCSGGTCSAANHCITCTGGPHDGTSNCWGLFNCKSGWFMQHVHWPTLYLTFFYCR